MERLDIAHHGDVALIVEDRLELRVSAVVLRNTSDVFRVMLSDKWMEGQSLRIATNSTPAELRLPDDDAIGMKLLCSFLHQRNDVLETEIEPVQLGAVADLADKYNCTIALKHTATTWLKAVSEDQIKDWPSSLVKTASIFDNVQQFARITKTIVVGGCVTHVLDHYLQASLNAAERQAIASIQLMVSNLGALVSAYLVEGHEFNSTLSSSRQPSKGPPRGFGVPSGSIRGGRGPVSGFSPRVASDYLPSPSRPIPTSSATPPTEVEMCTTMKRLATICLNELRYSGIWLIKDMMTSTNIGTLLELVGRLDIANASSVIDIRPCDHAMCLQHCQIFLNKVNAEVKELKQKTAEMFVGVCLDCFKAKGTASHCRYKHDK